MKSGRKPFWLRRSFLRGTEAEASTMASSSAPGSSCCPEWPDASWRCRSVSRISSGTKKNFNEICQNAIFTFWKTLKILRRETTQQSAVDDPTARLPNETLTADQIVLPFFIWRRLIREITFQFIGFSILCHYVKQVILHQSLQLRLPSPN